MDNNKHKIILVDDNKEFCQLLEEYLDQQKDMEVVEVGHNGKEGLELIKNNEFDVLILDLIMPHLDGIGVIKELEDKLKDIKIVVLTAFGQENIASRVVSLGIDYFIMKPFDLDQLAERIRDLFQDNSSSKENYVLKRGNEARTDSIKNKDLNHRITEVLHKLGVPAHIKGYLYLRKAIKMVIKEVDYLGAVTKKLYPEVADYFDTTPSRVERAIRHAIEVAWKKGNEAALDQYFSSTVSIEDEKPTNSQFIAKIADEIRLNIE